jgi:histidine ammonia-lyase
VAIELLLAAQGIDFRRRAMGVDQLGKGTAVAYDLIRQQVPFIQSDTTLYPYMEQVRQLVADGTIKRAVETAVTS